MAQCDSSHSDTKLAQSIVNSLQQGMYSLCENQDTYQREYRTFLTFTSLNSLSSKQCQLSPFCPNVGSPLEPSFVLAPTGLAHLR